MLRSSVSIVLIPLAGVFLACASPPQVDLAESVRSQRPAIAAPVPFTPIETPPGTLLARYASRPPVEPREADGWELPFQSKRLAVALLTIAAQGRLEDLSMVLTPDAVWGTPTPATSPQRMIFAEDRGAEFLTALRGVASQIPATAAWRTEPLSGGGQGLVRTGAEPMWSSFDHGETRIALREVIYRGQARIDYVGVLPMPSAPTR